MTLLDETVRSSSRNRWALRVAGLIVGLAVAQVSWFGFFLAGALVGLAARDVKWAVASGPITGIVCWGAFLGMLALSGSAGAYLSMGQITGLSAAIPVAYALLGSFVRGIV